MKRLKSNKSSDELVSAKATNELAHLIAPLLSAYCISTRQFDKALRYAVVQLEASRFTRKKANKAQIAFATGLTRSEVAQHLRRPSPLIKNEVQYLVDLWTSDPRFLGEGGKPAKLPIFGKNRSFEQLAKICGKGVPVRAILDELLDRGTASLQPGQRVQLHQPLAKERKVWAEMTNLIQSAVRDALRKDQNLPTRVHDDEARRTHLKRKNTAIR